jgi:hypothetical protein
MENNTGTGTKNVSGGVWGKIKSFVIFALNPSGILKNKKKQKWYLYLLFPASGWLLFFLQVGMERYRQGMYTAWKVILICILGFIIGYVMVGLIGALIDFILSRMKFDLRFDQVVSLIALSHTYMVFSVVLGLIYGLFGNSSSAAFGISGLLCTLLPIYAGIRTLGRGRAFMPPLFATLAGVILLGSWQLILAIVE